MGLFITFEGPDGSGKTTQIKLLREYLISRGITPVMSREPGGTPISEKIREIILDKENIEMDAVTEALLYAASRAQHVAQVIKPALDGGKVVICDRFVDSSIAYQGYGRKLGSNVEVINNVAVRGIIPNITFLINVAPEVGKSRISETSQDRIEAEGLSFHDKVYRGYMKMAVAEPQRIKVIDGTKSIEEMSREIIRYVEKLL